MKKAFQIFLIVLLLSSCKNEVKEEATAEVSIIPEEPSSKTYAEISIKEGGNWEGREYMNGHFKNVEALKVPSEHTDHSWYIRYEGPGWESNKVGYRIYLDWRNAIDIFGKVTDSLILQKVGQDGFDSYHEMSSWGMDILKAGKSLGIGALGRLLSKEVLHFKTVDSTFARVENLPNKSSVYIDYYGWQTGVDKINLKSKLSIKPDKRYTEHIFTTDKAIEGISTGIVKFDGIDLFEKQSQNGEWAYLATYGEQTLVPDRLGLAILYKTETVESTYDGSFDHLIVFKPTTEKITYYLLGAWEKEREGIKNKTEFINYLDDLLGELNINGEL